MTDEPDSTTVHRPLPQRPGIDRNDGLACVGTLARHGRNTHSQGIGEKESHADLRALVRISVDGQPKGEFHSRVKQVVGSKFDEQIFEVSPPSGYDGPYDHAAFAVGINDYLRRLIGPDNAAVTVAPGVKGVQMQGNLLMLRWRFEFRAGAHGKSW